MPEDFTDRKFRFERAKRLHGAATALRAAVLECDFRNTIVVRADGAFVDVGGVLLDVSHTGSYLKSSSEILPNQGEALQRALRRFGIRIQTMVDVGANFGEIALWFAREYPDARVLAIEPSSANLKILRRNAAAQSFPTQNVEIAHTAVGEKSGFVALSKGGGQMARVVADDAGGAERVPCERLDTLFTRYAIDRADFVKIDIEGSEPALLEAIAALGKRVRSYYIEFSQFAPIGGYLAIAEWLLGNGFQCYDEPAERSFSRTDEIEPHLLAAFAAGPIAATNIWFVAP